ncbi:MAG: hypothetical protein N3F10_07690 [Candidatus Bathyarchaeota archaeon]|nr:hypothetical protein [Candidatus Bathyarchaeota archaeon]
MAARRRETKLVKVYEDLVAKLNEEANKRGVAFFDFINEILAQAVRVLDMGSTIREVVDFYEAMMVQREAGLAMIPFEALDRIVEKFYRGERETLEGLWHDAGVWYGKYLSFRVKDESPFDVFIRSLSFMGWGIKEVTCQKSEDKIGLKCFSLTLSRENTKLLLKFVEGVMNALGYEMADSQCLRGVIEAEFKRTQNKKGKEDRV